MGEGCRPSSVLPEYYSGDVSSCACPACRGTSVRSLAGGSRAGR